MAITPPVAPIATTTKSITVTLKRWIAADDSPAGESINYRLVILDQNGQRIRWHHEQGGLASHLSDAGHGDQITIQKNFMDIVWAIAEDALL